jgi:hypothetical protein
MSGSDDEIVVAITAQTAQLNEGVAQATATLEAMQAQVAQEAQAFNAAVQTKLEAMVRLNTAFQGNLASSEGMAEAELALDQAMNTGAIAAEEYAGYVAQLDAAEAAAATTAEAATAAIAEQTAALNITGGVAREVGVMIGELARGNYTRLEGSTITLANRTGFLATALSALLSPLGLVAVAAAAVGVSIFEAGQEFEYMEGTVLATGGAAGYTAGQLVEMADHIAEHTGSISNASEAVQKLAESGRFAGQDLRLVAQAAADMAALTGESIQSCVAQIIRLQEDPVKAVAKLNDQFHFLTVAQFEQMEAAQQSGDSMGAASIAYQAMADKMQGRTDELNQHVNVLIRSWRSLRQVWNDTMQSADVALGGGDTAEELADQQRILKNLQDQNAALLSVGSSSAGLTAQIRLQTQHVEELTAKLNQEKSAAGAVGQAAQNSASQIDQMAKAFKGSGSDRGSAQNDKEQFEEMQLTRQRSLTEERAYWELILQTSQQGSDQYRQAVQQLIEIHNKEGEAAKEAARKSEEAARQRNTATMNELQVERESTQAASAERIQIDAQTTERALQLYGRESSEYKRALAERLADTKAYVSAVQELQKKQLEEAVATYQRAAQEDMKNVQAAFDHLKSVDAQKVTLGEMTTQQQLAAERTLAEQQYQIDLSILERWRETFADRKNVVDEVNHQIEALQRQHQQRMDQIDQQSAKQDKELWRQRLQPAVQAFDQSITGMIQGTQTMHQVWDRLLQDMLMSEIRSLTQGVANWVAGENAKTMATSAGNAERTASNAAASRTGMAENAAMSQKQIFNAAYTAAANTYSSVSQIPYVGWIMAPIAAAGAFAAVEGFDQVASAAGGWDRVPFDDAPALLHRNEMVLPAHLADRVRGMTGGDGGGGDVHHWNIQANDAKSVTQLLHSDPHGLSRAAKRAIQFTKNRR